VNAVKTYCQLQKQPSSILQATLCHLGLAQGTTRVLVQFHVSLLNKCGKSKFRNNNIRLFNSLLHQQMVAAKMLKKKHIYTAEREKDTDIMHRTIQKLKKIAGVHSFRSADDPSVLWRYN